MTREQKRSRRNPELGFLSRMPAWLKSLWVDPVGSNVIAATIIGAVSLVAAGFVIGWRELANYTSTWLVRPSHFNNAQVVAVSIATLVATIALIKLYQVLRRRLSARQVAYESATTRHEFKPFVVTDSRFALQWRIVKPQEYWLADTPSLLNDAAAVDGPFHSAPECLERLEIRTDSSDRQYVFYKCPRCSVLIFAGAMLYALGARAAVIEELRRQVRQARKIGDGHRLEFAKYWNAITPPKLTDT
jgi:hypothetical protein